MKLKSLVKIDCNIFRKFISEGLFFARNLYRHTAQLQVQFVLCNVNKVKE